MANARETAGPRDLAVITSSVALIASLLYVATAGVKIYYMGVFANVSRDLLWMSPLSNLIWYFAGWTVIAGIGRLVGGQKGFLLGVWCLCAVFVFSIFLRFTAIHRISAVIFAAGLATVTLGVFRRSPEAWLHRARVARNTLAVAFLVAILTVALRSAVAGRRALAALPDPPPGAPNLLLLVLDAARGDVLQSAGYARSVMPFLDSLSESGAHFTNAFATAPWTLPSHGTMFTGEYPGRLNTTLIEPLGRTFPTITERLQASGYYTYGVTANLHYTNWESGVDRGFLEWRDYKRSLRQLLRSSEIGQVQMILEIIDATSWRDVVGAIRRHPIYVHPKPQPHIPVATEVTDQILAWYDRRPRRPFLVYANYFDAHWTYDPPAPYRRRFTDQPGLRDLYDGELAYIDDELRRLFRELRRRGALENTVVIVTADHGEHFDEHGLTQHGNSLYSPVLHVPLIIVGPGVAPRRVESAVSLRDLPATILDLVGLEGPLPGATLTGHIGDSAYQSSPVLSCFGSGASGWKSYIDGEFHFVRRPGGEELYRYRTDTEEAHNLADADSLRPQLIRLREGMDRAIASHVAFGATGALNRR